MARSPFQIAMSGEFCLEKPNYRMNDVLFCDKYFDTFPV